MGSRSFPSISGDRIPFKPFGETDRELTESKFIEQERLLKEYLLQKRFAQNYGSLSQEDYQLVEQSAQYLLDKKNMFYRYFVNKYKLFDANGKAIAANKLTWPQLADMVDVIAHNTTSDEEFRVTTWLLFGTNVGAPLNQFINSKNIGLPKKYHNTKGEQEQFHHYLGGVTGDFNNSHLFNNIIMTNLFEIKQSYDNKSWNQGDIELFRDTGKHRDDFLRYGRKTVGPNIRRLLKGQ